MILVTGARGFVGKQVVRKLVEDGHQLRLVVRTRPDQPLVAARSPECVECPDAFAASLEWWRDALEGVDTVIHLAWYTEPGEYLHSPRNLACLQGTIELARACVAARVRRFVGIGTCAEYALGQDMVRADTPLNPQTLYAACKASLFQILGKFLPEAGVEFAWCRLFYLHGEGEHPRRLVPYLHRQLAAGQPAELTSGQQIRDFLDVRVAGELIARAAVSDAQGPLNICSGQPVTVRQLAEGIADVYGRRSLLHFGARPDNLFDPPYVVGVPAQLAAS